MIKHLRIDNRLIHGQVAVTWMRRINADALAVVNDDVAKDRIQQMALPLAARDAKQGSRLMKSMSGMPPRLPGPNTLWWKRNQLPLPKKTPKFTEKLRNFGAEN